MNELSAGDLSYLDLLIPSLLADAERHEGGHPGNVNQDRHREREQERELARETGHEHEREREREREGTSSERQQQHQHPRDQNSGSRQMSVSSAALMYSPLDASKIEFMARQLESGIDPYISSANGASMVSSHTADGIMAVAMSTGPDSLLTEHEEGSFVYNSTPYDNMLYDESMTLDFDADFGSFNAGNDASSGQLQYVSSSNSETYRPNDREKENVPLAIGAIPATTTTTTLTWQTPKKPGPQIINTPSTIMLSSAKQQRTILRNSTAFYDSQTPIRAVKTNSFTKLIAEASDTSPAKGRFISTARRSSVLGGQRSLEGGKMDQQQQQQPVVRSFASGSSGSSTGSTVSTQAGMPSSGPAPAPAQNMSFSMSQFQVQLSTNMSSTKSSIKKPRKSKKAKRVLGAPQEPSQP